MPSSPFRIPAILKLAPVLSQLSEKMHVVRTRADKTTASEQKGVMQWTGTLLRTVACFRLRSGFAMWFVH